MVACAMSSLTSRPLPSTSTSGRSRDYAQVQRPRVARVSAINRLVTQPRSPRPLSSAMASRTSKV